MIKNTATIILLSSLMMMTSCLKKETPIAPYDRGDVEQASVAIGGNYEKQTFFSLSNGASSSYIKTSWDLAFESTENGTRIILNTAKRMYAANTGSNNFNLSDTNGMELTFKWDNANLQADSYGWITTSGELANQLWVVDRGTDESLNNIGIKKIQLVAYDGDSFTMKYGNLDNTDTSTIQIYKNNSSNFTYFSFDNGGEVVSIEPDKENWDFLFTQYVHTFYTPSFEDYLVVGVLINHDHIEVAKVFDQSFEDIGINDVVNYTFSNSPNTIGYDWKFYDFGAGGYVIVPGRNYVIKNNQDGFYYKLRFIDFYDEQGEKGNPVFEYQKI